MGALTDHQRQLVQCALDAAASALESGEWPDLTGMTTGAQGVTVAPQLAHLAGRIGRDGAVVDVRWYLTADPAAAIPSEPVGAVEIAARLDVERSTVDKWRQRGSLPEPRWVVGGRPAWSWPDIAAWAADTGRLP